MAKKKDKMKPVTATLDSASLATLEELTKLSGLNVSEVLRSLIPAPGQAKVMYEYMKLLDKEMPGEEILGMFRLAYSYQALRVMIEDFDNPIGLQAMFVSNKPQSAHFTLILFLAFVKAKKKVKGFRFKKITLLGCHKVWIVLVPAEGWTTKFWTAQLEKYLADSLITKQDKTELDKTIAETRSRRRQQNDKQKKKGK